MNNKQKLTKIAHILIDKSLSQEQKLEKIKTISHKVDLIKSKKQTIKSKYTLHDIEKQICKHSGKSIQYIKNASGKECIWRMLAFYKACKFTNEKQIVIGQHFGKTGHSIVSVAKKTVQRYLDVDKEFKKKHYNFLMDL